MSDDAKARKRIAENPEPEPGFGAFAVQIAEGFAQADRRELLDAKEAICILRNRHSFKLKTPKIR